MSDTGALYDVELAYLYTVCKADSGIAYQYIRRLHKYGVVPDPPYIDETTQPDAFSKHVDPPA